MTKRTVYEQSPFMTLLHAYDHVARQGEVVTGAKLAALVILQCAIINEHLDRPKLAKSINENLVPAKA